MSKPKHARREPARYKHARRKPARRKPAHVGRRSPASVFTFFTILAIVLVCAGAVVVAVRAGTANVLGAKPPMVSPPTTTTTTPATQPVGTAGFNQPVMATPSGYSASNMILDDTFQGTSLNASHWSNVMGGPVPDVGPWGGYGGTPVVNNGLTLSNASSKASMVDTANPATGKNLFTFPASGFYVQVNFKVSGMGNGFRPSIWFPYDNGIHANANEIDLFEGGFLPSAYGLSGHPINNMVESNYGGCSCQDPSWDQMVVDAGEDITQNFVTVGMEFVPGSHVNFYVGQGANRRLILSDTNASNIGAFADYNLVITPQGAPSGSSSWHTQGAGTGSMYIAEVQVYSLPS